MSKALVAIERAATYEPEIVRTAIQKSIDAVGGWQALVRRGDRVLVKPNCICGAAPEVPAQTHPVVIVEVCRALLDFGAKPFVGDSPAWGTLNGNLRNLGALDGLSKLGVPVVEFKNPVRADNPRGRVFHRLTIDRAALEADAIVNLPKLKAHRQLLMTIAIKNMFGCVGGRRKAWWHVKAGSYENYFGRMLVETYDMLRPVVNILDAIVAMEGNGPARGTARPVGLLMASTDGPALECVAATIAGVPLERLRTIVASRELQVGTPYLEQTEIIGSSVESLIVPDFVLPKLLPIGFSLPRFVKGTFKAAWATHQEARLAKTA